MIARHRPFPVTREAAERWLHHMQLALDSTSTINPDSKLKMMNFFRYSLFHCNVSLIHVLFIFIYTTISPTSAALSKPNNFVCHVTRSQIAGSLVLLRDQNGICIIHKGPKWNFVVYFSDQSMLYDRETAAVGESHQTCAN